MTGRGLSVPLRSNIIVPNARFLPLPALRGAREKWSAATTPKFLTLWYPDSPMPDFHAAWRCRRRSGIDEGDSEPESGTAMLMGDFPAGALVIPGRCEASNPESRDSGFASSTRPGMTASGARSRKWLALLAAALFALGAAQPSLAADEPDAPKGAAVPVLRAAKTPFS